MRKKIKAMNYRIIEWSDWEECPICPYCKYEHEDYQSYCDSPGVITCENCEKDFKYDIGIEIFFATRKME